MNKNWYIALELSITPPTEDESIIVAQIDRLRERCAENNDSEFTKEFWSNLPKIRRDMIGNKNRRKKFIEEINTKIIPQLDEAMEELFKRDNVNISNFNSIAQVLGIPSFYIKDYYASMISAYNRVKEVPTISYDEISKQFNISVRLAKYLLLKHQQDEQGSVTTTVPSFNGSVQDAINIIINELKDVSNVTSSDFEKIHSKYGIPMDFIEDVYNQYYTSESSTNSTAMTMEDLIQKCTKEFASITHAINQNDIEKISKKLNAPQNTILDIYELLYPDTPVQRVTNVQSSSVNDYINITINTQKEKDSPSKNRSNSSHAVTSSNDLVKYEISVKDSVDDDVLAEISEDLNVPLEEVCSIYKDISNSVIMELSNVDHVDDSVISETSNKFNITIGLVRQIYDTNIKSKYTETPKKQSHTHSVSSVEELILHEISIQDTINDDILKEISEDLNVPIEQVNSLFESIKNNIEAEISANSNVDTNTFDEIAKKIHVQSSLVEEVFNSMQAPTETTATPDIPINKLVLNNCSTHKDNFNLDTKQAFEETAVPSVNPPTVTVEKVEETDELVESATDESNSTSLDNVPATEYEPPKPVVATFMPPNIVNVSVETNNHDKVNTVTWNAMFDENQTQEFNDACSYRIIRKENGIPKNARDGECIADNIVQNFFLDYNIDSCCEYGYAVVPEYNGTIYEDRVSVFDSNVRNIFELHSDSISVVAGSGVVKISWGDIPKNSTVRVKKGDVQLTIDGNGNSINDRDVVNGKDYCYTVCLIYNIMGRQYASNTVKYTVTPMVSLEPIVDIATYIDDNDCTNISYNYPNYNVVNNSQVKVYACLGDANMQDILSESIRYSDSNLPVALDNIIGEARVLQASDTIKIPNDYSSQTISIGIISSGCVILSKPIDLSKVQKEPKYTIASLQLEPPDKISVTYECQGANDSLNDTHLNRIIIMKSINTPKGINDINDTDSIVIEKGNFKQKDIIVLESIQKQRYYISLVCEYVCANRIWYSNVSTKQLNNVAKVIINYSLKKATLFNRKLTVNLQSADGKDFTLNNMCIYANRNAIPMIIDDSVQYREMLPSVSSVNGKAVIELSPPSITKLKGVLVLKEGDNESPYELRISPNSNYDIS